MRETVSYNKLPPLSLDESLKMKANYGYHKQADQK